MRFEGRATTPFFPTRRLATVLSSLLVANSLLYGIQLLLGPLPGPPKASSALKILMTGGTSAVFLHWLYLSRANLRAFGMRRIRYSRIWTVGSFLVPALNLVRPYQVLREIWQASNPEIADPVGWRHTEVPALLFIWWGSLVAWATFTAIAMAIQSGTSGPVEKWIVAGHINTLGNLAGVVGALLSLPVVSSISNAQHDKWDRTHHHRAVSF